MKRGRKPTDKLVPREPISPEPPNDVTTEVKKVYRDLARKLIAEGFACVADTRTVVLAASVQCLVDRLERELAAMPSLMGPNGVACPLLRELRSARTQLQSLYTSLLLTPRSRSASRLTKEHLRPGLVGDDLADFIKGNHASH